MLSCTYLFVLCNFFEVSPSLSTLQHSVPSSSEQAQFDASTTNAFMCFFWTERVSSKDLEATGYEFGFKTPVSTMCMRSRNCVGMSDPQDESGPGHSYKAETSHKHQSNKNHQHESERVQRQNVRS